MMKKQEQEEYSGVFLLWIDEGDVKFMSVASDKSKTTYTSSKDGSDSSNPYTKWQFVKSGDTSIKPAACRNAKYSRSTYESKEQTA